MATTVDANRTLSLFDDLSLYVHTWRLKTENADWSSLQIVQINRYEVLIPATILLYDYCITFSTEIDDFWSESSFTLASFLFVLNRYFSLLLTVPVALEFFAYLSEMVGRIIFSFVKSIFMICVQTLTEVIPLT
ncbi:hypothetical protein CERSUDRAFT_122665 [Gelatoporia subvermispora B]|uniref:DUF6533 domain-containing protein n=1 Tax=Ceriporiopsis subvermispora (strain B) TaxID=914234 RepID=M2RL87_CERS8|nr:hypothetical protein CERSUDRAFT_122665 [Gelatoporia subvermispora B]